MQNFLKMNSLWTLKVLLVTVAFQSRVETKALRLIEIVFSAISVNKMKDMANIATEIKLEVEEMDGKSPQAMLTFYI